MTDDYVDEELPGPDVAALIGVQPGTWRGYVARGQAPRPDGVFGGVGWWYRSTIEKWLANRPGPGSRQDLLKEG